MDQASYNPASEADRENFIQNEASLNFFLMQKLSAFYSPQGVEKFHSEANRRTRDSILSEIREKEPALFDMTEDGDFSPLIEHGKHLYAKYIQTNKHLLGMVRDGRFDLISPNEAAYIQRLNLRGEIASYWHGELTKIGVSTPVRIFEVEDEVFFDNSDTYHLASQVLSVMQNRLLDNFYEGETEGTRKHSVLDILKSVPEDFQNERDKFLAAGFRAFSFLEKQNGYEKEKFRTHYLTQNVKFVPIL